MARTLGTLITRKTMDPMERLKVSKEGNTMTNFVNTVSLGRMSRRKGEHAVKPGMGGSRQGQILHRHHCSQFEKIYMKKNCQIGTSVPVHLQHVPVHVTQKGVVAKVYRYTFSMYWYMLRKKGQWLKCTGTIQEYWKWKSS